MGKLRHGTRQASLQQRQDATAAAGVREEPCEQRRGSAEGTRPMAKEMSPRPRKHPVAGSAGATWLPSRNPPGAPRKGNVFWNWKKKKKLCQQGPGAASSSARPCVSAGPRGWPAPPQPRSWHTVGTAATGVAGLERCLRPSASPTPDPSVPGWELPGCAAGTVAARTPKSAEGN